MADDLYTLFDSDSPAYVTRQYNGPRYRPHGFDSSKDKNTDPAWFVGGSKPAFYRLEDAVLQARDWIAKGVEGIEIIFIDEYGGCHIPKREWDQLDDVRSVRARQQLGRYRHDQ